jgi:hypothetical protein
LDLGVRDETAQDEDVTELATGRAGYIGDGRRMWVGYEHGGV